MAGEEFLKSIETNFHNAVTALNEAMPDDRLSDDLSDQIIDGEFDLCRQVWRTSSR